MASFFKPRRRKPSGPNKNQKKVMRGEAASHQGLLKDRFPAVERLEVELEFMTPRQELIDQEVRELGPDDPLDVSAPCPGRCGRGSFDVAAKVRSIIEARETQGEATGVCREILFPGSPEACEVRLRCRIRADYRE
jgi:hypothetical protein